MSAASNYLENKLLDHTLTGTAFTQPAARYLALFLNTSTNAATNLEAGTLTDEVSTSGTAYARQVIYKHMQSLMCSNATIFQAIQALLEQ